MPEDIGKIRQVKPGSTNSREVDRFAQSAKYEIEQFETFFGMMDRNWFIQRGHAVSTRNMAFKSVIEKFIGKPIIEARDTVVVIGNTTMCKGAPVEELKDHLRKYFKVVEIPEYWTSRTHWICEAHVSRIGDQAVCHNGNYPLKNLNFHADKNAAFGILYVAIHLYFRNGLFPDGFRLYQLRPENKKNRAKRRVTTELVRDGKRISYDEVVRYDHRG